MQRVIAFLGRLNRLGQRWVGKKVPGIDGAVDAGELLVHHATGADIQMPDLGIAHLPLGQADFGLGGVDQSMRKIAPKLVPIRLLGLKNSIIRAIGATAETIQNNKENWGDFHVSV